MCLRLLWAWLAIVGWALAAAFTVTCGPRSMTATTEIQQPKMYDQQVAKLATLRVFFGHKSVGANIVEGIRALMATDPALQLKPVTTDNPASIVGPALMEMDIGENGKPQSKNAAFAAALSKGMGNEGGIAMFKYCYVDVTSSTDVRAMFADYRRTIQAVESAHPEIRIVHITVPLTTADSGAKAWIESVLGRSTARTDNAKRNEFNRLLKQAYPANSIFDLAEAESTRPDGSRSYLLSGNDEIYTLAEEYTTDGGHLNELGKRVVAGGLLVFLATR